MKRYYQTFKNYLGLKKNEAYFVFLAMSVTKSWFLKPSSYSSHRKPPLPWRRVWTLESCIRQEEGDSLEPGNRGCKAHGGAWELSPPFVHSGKLYVCRVLPSLPVPSLPVYKGRIIKPSRQWGVFSESCCPFQQPGSEWP